MFGKLKEKLKGWIKKSTEEIEKKSEKVEKLIKKEEIIKKPTEKPKPAKSEKDTSKKLTGVLDKELGKAEHTKEKDEAEILSEKPAKEVVEVLEQKQDETSKDVSEKIDKVKQEIEEVEKQIQKEKKEKNPPVPTKFNSATHTYEPDIEEIKQETKEVLDEIEAVKERKSFFKKIKSSFTYKISEEEFKDIFEDLEFLLLESNVALEVVDDIKEGLSKKLIGKEINKNELEIEIKNELKKTLNEILIEPDNPLEIIKQTKKSEHRPFVILFFGINGTGKTTSIAKMTNLLKENNLSVVLAAGDTFRAASIEQIQIHADKLKVPLVKHDYNSDPSAVGFDAIKYAQKHKIDVVLIDTAGRMHTRTNLIAEMEKICRVTNPDLKIFVAESIAGNDAIEQAKTFHNAIEIDGSILSKADIDEKGGTIISISYATNKPIFYLGVGQKYKDIQLFDKQKFINELGL